MPTFSDLFDAFAAVAAVAGVYVFAIAFGA